MSEGKDRLLAQMKEEDGAVYVLISGFPVIIPAVQRISPELSVCGEAIRRAAGYCKRHIVSV